MTTNQTPDEPVVTSYANAPARTISTHGVTFAYRELGPKGGVPVIFFVHLAATLDNWDPRIIDPIAKNHHVIAFDNQGVGASTGRVPGSIEAMADDAYASFIDGLPVISACTGRHSVTAVFCAPRFAGDMFVP